MAFHRHHRDDGTFQGPIISGAPFGGDAFDAAAIAEAGPAEGGDADAGDSDDEHRNDEQLVTLTRAPTRFAADMVVAELESCGIKAGAVGHRVVVFERDLATARAIITETDDAAAADDEPIESGGSPSASVPPEYSPEQPV